MPQVNRENFSLSFLSFLGCGLWGCVSRASSKIAIATGLYRHRRKNVLLQKSILTTEYLRSTKARENEIEAENQGKNQEMPHTRFESIGHFDRVAKVVRTSLGCTESIVAAQAAAVRQIDVAEYSLHRMLEELASVMTPPIAAPQYANVAQSVRALPRLTAIAA